MNAEGPKITNFFRFQEQERLIRKLNETLSPEQQTALHKFGHTQMTEDQLEMFYSERGMWFVLESGLKVFTFVDCVAQLNTFPFRSSFSQTFFQIRL